MYKSNWPYFTSNMIDNVAQILKSGKVNQWTGTKVSEFQQKFSQYFGVKHSIAVFNGSVALELCLKAIDLNNGDEVIVTPRTFIASASSITICGGRPVFVDVDRSSQNVTLDNIKGAVSEKTKAVILVHLAGWPCDLEEIVEWCHSKNIYVIEDCAQAHGAKYKDKYIGTYGDINAWSFCQDKIISTGGEGGMVTTDNYELFQKAWSYKDHGKNYDKTVGNKTPAQPGLFRWVHDSIGTNWRMTEIQASIGIDSLELLDEWIQKRRQYAEILNKTLSNLKAIRLTIPDEKYYHAYYKYYCYIKNDALVEQVTRDTLILELNKMGIPCFEGTCGEVYRELAYNLDINLPVTQELSKTALMFLVDPSYNSDTINKMAGEIRDVILKYTK